MNNISQHVILPNKWKLGQYYPSGTIYNPATTTATQFFPFVITSGKIFPIPKNWRSVYGTMYRNIGSIPPLALSSNSFTSAVPFTIYDGTAVTRPSKFLSIILYK